jgi:signal transduction histidine kinase
MLLMWLFVVGIDYVVLAKESDTTRINSLNAASFELIKEYPDSARSLAHEAIRLSERMNYLQGLGDGYIRLGILEKDNGNYPQAIAYYRKSLQYRLQIGDRDLVARVYNNIGATYSKQSMYDSAAYYLIRALREAESLNLKPAQAMYSMNLGIAYQKNHDHDMALQYIRQARRVYESEADSSGMVKCMINEASVHYNMKNYRAALPLYRNAIHLAGILGNTHEKYLAMGDLALTYMDLSQYDSSLFYLRQALRYHMESENEPAVAVDMSNMGMLFFNMDMPDSAVMYLQRSLAQAESLRDFHLAAKNAGELSEIWQLRRMYEKALDYHRLFKQYNDSVFSEAKTEAIADMQTRYETEKKEAEIKLLNKDKEIQQARLNRKTLVQWFMMAAIAVAAVISGLFFNRYKLKRTIQAQEALLNERRRISSELHDDLGAQLSTARMFLNKLRESKGTNDSHAIIENSLNLIDGSINDLRRIMDDLQASTLQEKGLIAAIEELVNKINQLQEISFVLSHHGLESRLEQKTEHQLFRIAQELVNNTLKYANAKKVTIDFTVRDDSVVLVYEDNGKGFDVKNAKRGYGLSNIESRARSLGGSADFDSRPGAGSLTTIELPLRYATEKA